MRSSAWSQMRRLHLRSDILRELWSANLYLNVNGHIKSFAVVGFQSCSFWFLFYGRMFDIFALKGFAIERRGECKKGSSWAEDFFCKLLLAFFYQCWGKLLHVYLIWILFAVSSFVACGTFPCSSSSVTEDEVVKYAQILPRVLNAWDGDYIHLWNVGQSW